MECKILGMVMYDNEFETMECKILGRVMYDLFNILFYYSWPPKCFYNHEITNYFNTGKGKFTSK